MTTTTAKPRQRAFVVSWSDLERWVIPASALMGGKLPKGWTTTKIGDLAKVVSDRVQTKADTEYKMAGVRWYGQGVFHRETVRGDKLSAKYVAPLQPGALIYNRLFAWKESFAVVPDELSDCFVSNEFPQFTTDAKKILPEYLYLWSISEQTTRAVNAASTGSAAVSRNRFREDFFLEFDIALPPLSVQQAIVNAWRQAQDEVADTRRRIAELEDKIEADFLAELGLKKPSSVKRPKGFAIPWSNLARWGVDLAWHEYHQSHESTYDRRELGEICKTGTGGTPSRKRREYFGGGIPWVKTTEVRGGVITETEETLSEEGMANCQAKLYPAGSIIMAMYGQGATRGRSAKLGIEATTNQACLVMTEFIPEAVPDFVWYYLQARYHDIRAMGSGNNQPNLSAELIRAYPVPLPPLPIQRRLVSKVTAQRDKIAALKAEANQNQQQAKAKVEAMILGTKPVSG